jgi:hypothetical protein
MFCNSLFQGGDLRPNHQPFVAALFPHIHPGAAVSGVLPVFDVDEMLRNTARDHCNVAQHFYVHGAKFK